MKIDFDSKIILGVGIVISLLFIIVTTRLEFFSALDHKYYDYIQNSFKNSKKTLPVIVDIDEKSLTKMGQWPWPRYRVAQLLENINNAGALSVGLDIIFAEPDRSSLIEIKKDIFNTFGYHLNLKKIPEKFLDNDKALATVLSKGKFVAGFKFITSETEPYVYDLHPVDALRINRNGNSNGELNLFSGKNVAAPVKTLAESLTHSGFVNVAPDNDGVIRRIPLLMKYKNKIYPSLALSVFMQTIGTRQLLVEASSSSIKIKLKDTAIPVDKKGNLLIKFLGERKTFEYISAADILNNRFDKSDIKDRIVFVGASSAGLMDIHTTPLDTLFPGVEVHASVLQNILQKDFLERPLWATGAELFITLCAGIISSVLLSRKKIWINFSLMGVGVVIFWYGCVYFAQKQGLYFSPVSPITLLIINTFILYLIRFRMTEKREFQHIRELDRMDSELNIARNIQMGFLPSDNLSFSDRKEFEIFADLIPARKVGGDLYDYFFIDDDHLCFALGDVSDKGVPASLFMAITITLIKHSSAAGISPSEMLKKVNESLSLDNPNVMFVTLIIGILNIRTGKIRYSNGGHNPPVIIRQDEIIESRDEINDPIVGFSPDIDYKEISIDLKYNDTILLYTDGITEAMNVNEELFSKERLLKECQKLMQEPVQGIVSGVIKKVKEFSEKVPQTDDIAVLGIRYCGN